MDSSNNNGQPPNPLLTNYEHFVQTCPLFTRYILTGTVVSYLFSFFIDFTASLSCVPYFVLFQFQWYRLLTSILVGNAGISLIFAAMVLNDCGRRLEHALGSSAFLILVAMLIGMANGALVMLSLSIYVLSGFNQTSLLWSAEGIWSLVLSLMAIEACSAPADAVRQLPIGNVQIKVRYYPLLLLGLFTLLGGPKMELILGTAIGYAYGLGYLDRIKVGQERLTRWESGCLVNFTRRPGWVAGHSASGLGEWSALLASNARGAGDQNESAGSGGILGRISPPSNPVQAADGPVFPATGGHTLGGGEVSGITNRGSNSSDSSNAAERRAAAAEAARRRLDATGNSRTDEA